MSLGEKGAIEGELFKVEQNVNHCYIVIADYRRF